MTMPESEAIPFEPQDLRGERLLVLAPHPDDEVIGCGGLVALHLREFRSVHVVVATDGAQAGDGAQREAESRAALAILGNATIEFLRIPDRQLERARDLDERLAAILRERKPDLVAVPSPMEIHPDHIALSRAFCGLIARDPSLFAELAVARVAFYEVSAPLRPNTLVDITPVSDSKYTAIEAHASQTAIRDYTSYARGLNAWRAMTLPPNVKSAEAYWTIALPSLRTTPFSALREAMGPQRIEIVKEPLPISVIVRTRDRAALLAESVQSIRASGYPAEIVVVNDGGTRPNADGVTLVDHETSRGRSEAANAGVRAAKNPYIAFLDDDDLYYPEHLATLSNAAHGSNATAWYSDAVSAFIDGESREVMRIYGRDFDRELLLVDNYIPLPTLLLRRADFLDLDGFDPAFDLFEDWDFLIRLAQRGDFVRVPQITCEIRHIKGGGSVILSNPEGSAAFREAKLHVWRKHAALMGEKLFANVFEREKQRTVAIEGDVVDAHGALSRMLQEVARIERDKQSLIAQIGALSERINETMMRISHLEGANAEVRGELALARSERYAAIARLAELEPAFAGSQTALAEMQRTNGALYAEVARLQNLLDTIFRSRTWKLHSIVERMKGRG
ncbi:MAG TPA: PIG-L family deacetylase [Thermoanaerobaculia bacterium]|jgi:LmbE family N-acetylglucosaminyl deacetylase/glycosyltransferase involved in cell wall biosynthesis|nr:PIG-L family deacetylase [Thermoanaerobaculia bacterium]